MLKNIYTPVSGALSQERVLEIISNNLANVNTVGFKGDQVAFELLEPEPDRNYKSPIPPANYKVSMDQVMPFKGNEMAYVGIADVSRDRSQGPAISTRNSTDLMIEGEGLFQVSTTEGMRYTRAGNLNISPDGALVTTAGHPIMGEKGPIHVRSNQFDINANGEVYQDGQLLDRIQLFKPQQESQLERVGSNYFINNGPEEAMERVGTPRMTQGFLEGSNVNAIKSLTAMIVAHRSYEAYQKAISNYDHMMEKSSNVLGEVRT